MLRLSIQSYCLIALVSCDATAQVLLAGISPCHSWVLLLLCQLNAKQSEQEPYDCCMIMLACGTSIALLLLLLFDVQSGIRHGEKNGVVFPTAMRTAVQNILLIIRSSTAPRVAEFAQLKSRIRTDMIWKY